MSQELPKERRKILAEIFEELHLEADKSAMLGRASAILTEAEKHGGYQNSISVSYADEAYSILNHPNYEQKQNATLNVSDKAVFDNVAHGLTLRQYCLYLLERARENYVNEGQGDHELIASKIKEFLEKQ